MERLPVYNGVLAIIGIIFGFNALALFVTGERGLPMLLIATGSFVMITSAIYESVSTDSSEFEISSGKLLVVLIGGFLSLIGTALEFVFPA